MIRKILFFLIPFFSVAQIQIGKDIYGTNLYSDFGNAISLSADGKIVAVGAVGNNVVQQIGLVRIYQNVSGNWIKIGNDLLGDNSADKFGFTVSLSSDGDIVAIGVPFKNNRTGQVQRR